MKKLNFLSFSVFCFLSLIGQVVNAQSHHREYKEKSWYENFWKAYTGLIDGDGIHLIFGLIMGLFFLALIVLIIYLLWKLLNCWFLKKREIVIPFSAVKLIDKQYNVEYIMPEGGTIGFGLTETEYNQFKSKGTWEGFYSIERLTRDVHNIWDEE